MKPDLEPPLVELLPCPFCGSSDLHVSAYSVQPDDYHGGYVSCIECDAQGAGAISLDGWLSNPGEAEAAARTAWNTRTPPPAMGEEGAIDAHEAREVEVARLREDKARLDFLDRCNQSLNERYGTNYRWSLILNHNVTRLMLNDTRTVDLHDSEPNGLPSCRDAIDRAMQDCGAALTPTPPAGGS